MNSMSDIHRVLEYLETHRAEWEDLLLQYLRIPSVSADPSHAEDVRKAARWTADLLEGMGFSVELVDGENRPIVYAESPRVEGAPTVLVYGHYDVQPAEDPSLWETPPFEPSIREGAFFARGACDNKGQILPHILAVRAWKEAAGRLPLNFKFIVEGEEEVGSRLLERFIDQAAERLACDCVVISDTGMPGPDQPAVTYGLRGIAYFEIRLTGPNRDLHSGSFGGAVTNPCNALATMLAGLIDDHGRIQIPGFYDDVAPLSDEERARIRAVPFDEKAYFRMLGVETAAGEKGYSVLERRWARPTYDVCGVWGGYQGAGAKTVIPSQAGAKLSFRLVPHQDPAKVAKGLEIRLRQLCPPGVRLEIIDLHASPAVLTPLDSPYLKAAERALAAVFPNPPVAIREGGSIPIVARFQQRLGTDVLLIGFAQEDDNAHAPNEKYSVQTYHRAMAASARLWDELRRGSDGTKTM